ncbi:FTR1 family protein [Streptomyces sp. NPDC059744]|uniref:FTR1 family protein n=1 Tax=Streptomyces sp. NPDC059744 TaxID=3346929 RepID=UPI003667BD64
MMGVLGTEALAAGGLALVIFNQLRTMGVGLVSPVGNQVAATAARTESTTSSSTDADPGVTAGPDAEVRGLVRAAMAVATLAGVAGAVLMILIGQAATYLGQDAAVVHRAQGMLSALAPGLLPCLWFQAIRQFTVAMRRPQALLQITLASVAVKGALSINLAKFFRWTGAMLIIVAAGVLAYGVHDLQGADFLPGLNHLASDISTTIPRDSWYGTLLKSVFNFQPDPTLLQVIVWVLYLLPVMAFFLAPGRTRPAPQPPKVAAAPAAE